MSSNTSKPKQLMFVCTGNTCRSTMAEYLFKEVCKEEGIDIELISRGIAVDKKAKGAQQDAIDSVLRLYPNSAIKSHKPTQITLYDIVNSDLILTMGKPQKDFLCVMAVGTYVKMNKGKKEDELLKEAAVLYNFIAHKTFTLEEVNKIPKQGIQDPYGKILTPIYKIYAFALKLAKAKGQGRIDKMFEKVKFYPSWGPFKGYKQKVYDECREEIRENLKLLADKLK